MGHFAAIGWFEAEYSQSEGQGKAHHALRMIFILDTNVLSEGLKLGPRPSVSDFLRRVPTENLRVSAMTLAEIAQGVENNPTPELKSFLTDILGFVIVPFGESEALEWGRLTSTALAQGATVQARDGIIAATAAANGWTVATRNVRDFKPFGVKVFDPWTDTL